MVNAHRSEAASAGALTIGYVQVGSPAHGICRYGRLLVDEGRHRPPLNILEENIELDGDEARDCQRLEAAASRLSAADVVHAQVSLWGAGSWGAGSRARRNLQTFRRACRAPIVFTLHDVTALIPFEKQMPVGVLRTVLVEMAKGLLRPLVHRLRRVRRPMRPARAAAWWNPDGYRAWRLARWLTDAGLNFVLTTREQRLLASMALSRKTALIPHFVEDPPPPKPVARPARQRKAVILAGFIFDAKGHRMMVEAMPLLPDVEVTFVGGSTVGTAPVDGVSGLTRLAGELGVLDRLQVTGYLPEEEYQGHLMKADLAVCPFGPRKAASGSLSSLIAAGCPVVASDIPLIREYNDLVPDAIATFSPYTPEALAGAVRGLLDRPRTEAAAGLEELRRRLSIHAIYDRHLDHYSQVAREDRRRA